MKNIFKTMLPILAMAACVWTSCSDDKDKTIRHRKAGFTYYHGERTCS